MPAKLERIMLVEDDHDIRTIAEMALQMVGGYAVRACDGGEAALAAVQEFKPQLIVLDVMMPGMDGPTTLGRLRALPAAANAPVVFLTAKVQPEEVTALRALGAVEVVAKPFDPMTLGATLAAIWEKNGS